MNIKDKVRAFVSNYIGENSVCDEDNMFEMGVVNSLFGMQLIRFVEDEFELSISNDDMDIDNFKSINAITDLITRLKNNW